MTVTWKITEAEQELFYPWGRLQTQALQKAVSAESIPPHPGKEFACNAGDAREGGLILGLGRPSGEENGDQLQDSCFENPKDRRAWWATVHAVAKSQT